MSSEVSKKFQLPIYSKPFRAVQVWNRANVWATIRHEKPKTATAVSSFPITTDAQEIGKGPYLECDFYLTDDGEVNVSGLSLSAIC